MGSLFKQLLRFSGSLKDSIRKQDEVLVLLSAVTGDFNDSNDEIFGYSCDNLALTTRTDVGYVLNKLPQTYELHIKRTYPGQEDEPTPALEMGVSFGGQFSEEEAIIDEVIIDLTQMTFTGDIGLGVSLSDICAEVAVGQSMNEAIAGINDMFLSHTNVSTTDAISSLSTIPFLDKNDERELIQTILTVSNQGLLSNYAWSGALRSLLSSGQEAVEGGSILLQEDSPFIIQSFMNTVLYVAQMIFSAILVALASVLQGLLAIILTVVSVVFTTFKSITTDIDIDPNSNNEYVCGVFGANASFKRDQFPDNGDILKHDSAIRSVVGPFELFTWANDASSNSTINMNVFMNLSFNAVELMDTLKTGASLSIDDEPDHHVYTLDFPYSFNPYSSPSMDDNYAHDSEYLLRLHFDKDELLLQYKRCTMMSALALLEKGGTYTVTPSWPEAYSNTPIERMIGRLLACLAICKRDSVSLADMANPGTHLPNVTECRDYLNAIREHFDDAHDLTDIRTSFIVKEQRSGGWGGKYVDSLMNSVQYCFRPLVDATSLWLGLKVGDEEWDQLIPTPSVTLPSVSTAEVIAAISLIIGAVGAAFIASKSISRKLRARRQVKLAKRTAELNKKRDAYLKDPQNKELKAEYTSALISYEKRASLFGWPSYDAVNGRMNVNTQSSTASSLLNGFLNTTDTSDTSEYIASLIK